MPVVRDQLLKPLGYEQLTSAGAVLVPTVPAGACRIMIVAETKAIRIRDDGTNPSGTVGFIIPANTIYYYTSSKPGALRIIEDGGTSTAKINLLYYA